jgi:NitT/TauT family transport system substrate-binding protein
MRRCIATKAALIALLLLAPRPALAQQVELRIVRPADPLALPLVVMQHEHLIERTAEAMGLGAVRVTWSAPGEAGPLKAIETGAADMAMADLVPLLLAEDVSNGAPPVAGLAAVAACPYVLVTRNPAIHTILDFTAKDRIAVPAVPLSQPALLLEMAASQEWGPVHWNRLDPLLVARPDRAADEALLSGKGDIDAHFAPTPYSDDELADGKLHRVMDSFDIAGPHTVAVLAAAARLQTASPELLKAVLAAVQAADDFIRKNRGEAAEFMAGLSGGEIAVEDLTDMIGAPDLSYDAAPRGVMRLAGLMHRTGRLKRRPTRWQDFFLPAARDLKGS